MTAAADTVTAALPDALGTAAREFLSQPQQLLIGEGLAELVVSFEDAAEAKELVLHRIERAFGAGDLKDRGRVRVQTIGHAVWLLTWLM